MSTLTNGWVIVGALFAVIAAALIIWPILDAARRDDKAHGRLEEQWRDRGEIAPGVYIATAIAALIACIILQAVTG